MGARLALTAIAAALLAAAATAGTGVTAEAVALDLARVEDRILDPAAHARITYENTVNVASYQQDGVLTYNGYQYTAWYRNDGPGPGQASAVLARRQLPDGAWESLHLAHPLWSNDSHNTIALGVTPSDGRLHVTFPTHDNPVRYTRTIPGVLDQPGDFAWSSRLFERVHVLFPGAAGAPQTFTYPQFENVQGQTLLTWRHGSTDNGRQALLRYNDDAAGTWTFLGRFTHSAGGTYNGGFGNSTSRYGYLHGFSADPASGALAVTMSWREQGGAWCTGPLAVGNHDLGYAISGDAGLSWENNAGAPVAATTTGDTAGTITPFTPGIVVEPIGINKGLINQETQGFDSQGRLHVVTSRVPDEEIVGDCVGDFYAERLAKARPYHHWRDAAGTWHTMQLPFPSGSAGRAKIAFDSEDNAYLVLPDARIVAASAASGWSDWEVVFSDPEVENVSELIVDRQRARESEVLTVAYQEPPPDVPTCRGNSSSAQCASAYRLASFALGSADPDAAREMTSEAAPVAFEGFADDDANLALNRDGGGDPEAFASSSQASFPPALANDGNVETFWVSAGTSPGQGPSEGSPIDLGVDLGEAHPLGEVTMVPRVNFGPRAYAVEISSDGEAWSEVASVGYAVNGEVTTRFPTTEARYLRLRFTDSWDSVQPPRNVQVAELIVRARDDSADPDPPEVEAELSGPQDPAGTYLNQARLALSAGDEGSGVDRIEYRVNGGDWQQYAGSLRFTEPGSYSVEYRASDLAGNGSEAEQVSFAVALNGSCSSPRSDEFDGAELDGGRWSYRHPTTPESGPGSPSASGGELVLPLGAFSLDLSRPGPIGFLGQPLPEGDFKAIAKISAPDLGSDAGGQGSTFAQAGLKILQGDDSWIKVAHTRAADASPPGATSYFELSYESSSSNRVLGPRTGTSAGNLPTWWLRVERSGSELTAAYSLTDPEGLGGGDWVELTANPMPNLDTVMPLGDGPRYIGPYGGNGSSAARFDYVRVEPDEVLCFDFEPPTTAIRLNGADPLEGYQGPVTVSFEAEDGEGGTGVESTRYALDGGALQTYGGPFTVSAAGAHALRFFSVDAAGNEEAEQEVSFAIASSGTPRPGAVARLGKLRKRLPAARLARRGLRVSGRCAGVAGGTLKLIAPKRFARKLRLGRRATPLASRRMRCLGGSFRATLRPKPRARKALRRLRGRARLRLKLTMSGPAGRATAGATLVVRGR